MSGWAFACAAKSGVGGDRRSSSKSVSMLRVSGAMGGDYGWWRWLLAVCPWKLGGAPTGNTDDPFMPLITPAADAYHATSAVAMPTQPPRWIHSLFALPFAASKFPITSRSSVASSVRNTRNTATLTWVDQRSM